MVSEIPYLRRDMGIPPKTFSSGIISEIAERFSLEQNYPNPFNPTTTIRFQIPDDGIVSLNIYNILGQEVVTLLQNEELEEGEHEIQFDASKLSSGVYFYRIYVEQNGISLYNETKKLLLMK